MERADYQIEQREIMIKAQQKKKRITKQANERHDR